MDRATLTKHWHWETDRDGLAWLTFDKQGESANTFSREALEQLRAALDETRGADPKGLVIRWAKRGFIAGADVEEFTRFKSPAEAMSFVRLGWDAFQALHELPFPTTAMVNGFCMGGGVELALACRYRVALDDPKTRFALPEVMLGILPAWHGVQWLPKLVGPAAAFDMLLTGKSVDARRAQRIGLVDQAVPLRILENTARIITLESPKRKRLSFWKTLMLSGPFRTFVVSQARRQVARKAKREHYPAPYAILELWKRYDGDPFRAAGDPAASVEALFAHPTTANLIRIFFLQERLKSLGKAADFAPRYVHIVGAGVMGGDIAAICAMRGLTATLQDTAPEDPSRLVGIHFFNPVPQLQLVEIVSGDRTNAESARKAAAFVRHIDKLPLPVKDAPGFLVNRVLGPYMYNAFRMLDQGVKPETLDRAMEDFGMPMGPAELADTVGLDICLAAGKALAKKFSKDESDIPQVLVDKVKLGHLGRKTGQGIYRYEKGRPVKGRPDAYDDALVQSLIAPYLNEARAAVAEGIVADADLADAGLIFGTGFAPFRGGPLHYLESQER